jgi:hypothetical protein
MYARGENSIWDRIGEVGLGYRFIFVFFRKIAQILRDSVDSLQYSTTVPGTWPPRPTSSRISKRCRLQWPPRP